MTGEEATFLQRCVKHYVGRISEEDVSAALKGPLDEAGVNIEPEALGMMIKATGGYPYMVQLVGSAVWDAAQDVSAGLTQEHAATGISVARREIGKNAIQPAWAYLDADSRLLFEALASLDGEATLPQLIEAAEIGSDQDVSSALRELLGVGLFEQPEEGVYDFAYPGSRDWVKARVAAAHAADGQSSWPVPAPSTPEENGVKAQSDYDRVKQALSQSPKESYWRIARREGVSRRHVRKVAIMEGLERGWFQRFFAS